MPEAKTCRIGIRKDYDSVFFGNTADKRKSVLVVIDSETAELDYICIKKRGKANFVIFPFNNNGLFYFNTVM